MRSKRALILMMSLLIAGTVAASGSSSSGKSSAKPPIRFALISFKLPALNLLDDYYAGASAAAKQINAKGGFGGRKAVIDVCNSQLQQAAATVCANQTLANRPVLEFGCETNWGTTGLQTYTNAGIPSFNCVNSEQDLTSPWSFALNSGGVGEESAMARFLCRRSSIHSAVFMAQANPTIQQQMPAALSPILNACGKEISFVFFPLTGAVDLAPYVAQALQKKPDFIITHVSGAACLQLMNALKQQGWPASQVSINAGALDYKTVLEPAGSAMNGVYALNPWKAWGSVKDPEVAAYLKAARASGANAKNGNVQRAYVYMMWFYTAAKKIGFAKFNAKTLTKFMRTATGVHIPMSRSLINPGPKGYPAVKQPYVQIQRWINGDLTAAATGTKGGWVAGLK